ncbi:peptidoglycan/LPS O-acetylase OafA/YrhL [Paucibacter oligotrophus]|uniref:Peptidoglycan/LPS O-acetylase OafA/YrhL n=1 Tax=Roseateles oligotrophus TaxID=1769250 RepID=A0A840L5K8_9BURK|nr:acyltransferase family protein [Roseateles oligotrophus]MBB4843306.1 peptidoglycan/LPS O-acetylase OafA/YrhL [Roseateles oligotrophus]
MSSPVPKSRLLHVDALKALAAQLIVLHHLAAYGPIADAVAAWFPRLMDHLFHEGRMAVQLFLVLGGFLSARGLAPRGQLLGGSLPELLWRRYLRLVLPFLAALGLTLACSWLVRPWLPELTPATVSLPQLLSHGLLLHDVLGYEALTVGAWYVAMDFQLFAFLLGLLWLARRLQPPRQQPGAGHGLRAVLAPGLVLLMCLASLFVFNRDAGLDVWAPYFFGAYGLGALVHWLGLSPYRRAGLLMLTALVSLALVLEFRERIALALATALVLAGWQQRHRLGKPLLPRFCAGPVVQLGTQSYALFLVHFPICLLVNAVFAHQDMAGGGPGVLMLLAAWGLSNLAALPFYRWVELPSSRLGLGLGQAGLLKAS